MPQLTIRAKLIVAMGALLVVQLVYGIIGWTTVRGFSKDFDHLYDNNIVPLEHLSAINDRLNWYRLDSEAYPLSNPQRRAEIKQDFQIREDAVYDAIDAIYAMALTPEEETALTNLDQSFTAYLDVLDQVIGLVDQGRDGEANAVLIRDATPDYERALSDLNTLQGLQYQIAAELNEQFGRDAAQSTQIMIITLVVSLLIGAGVVVYLSRSISSGIGQMVRAANAIANQDLARLTDAMQAVANGDLTRSIQLQVRPLDIDSADEIGQLARAFNQMISSLEKVKNGFNQAVRDLNDAMRQVQATANSVAESGHETRHMAEQIASATQEVASTIQDVAQGSAAQAEQVSSVSTAFEQMAQTIEAVARGAQEQGRGLQGAASLVQTIAETNRIMAEAAEQGLNNAQINAERARAGNETVQRTVQAMSTVQGQVRLAAERVAEMGERSKQIELIVKAIEELTEQVNLLALNAAIEAARAGEAGKGFAVVAEEVRKLAERSSASTQEIAELIQGVQGAVGDAVTAMQEGVAGVEAVAAEADEVRQAFDGILAVAGELEERNRRILQAAEEVVERSQDLQARMEDTSAIAEENSAAAEQMAATSRDVRTAMQSVSAVTEQNAAASEQVSAATEETATQLEEVTAAAAGLQELADSLQTLVGRFKLTGGTNGARQRSASPLPQLGASRGNGAAHGGEAVAALAGDGHGAAPAEYGQRY